MAGKEDLVTTSDVKEVLVVEEITSLNLNDLDVDELERRVELAFGDVSALCFIDICFLNFCFINTCICNSDVDVCVGNCPMACGANCPGLCNLNCSTEERGCGEV
jgi:hypothetical protein